MSVVEVVGPSSVTEYAAAVERLSSHPIAEAIARLDARRTASDLTIQPGKGAVASVDGRRVAVGGKSLLQQWVGIFRIVSPLRQRPSQVQIASFPMSVGMAVRTVQSSAETNPALNGRASWTGCGNIAVSYC